LFARIIQKTTNTSKASGLNGKTLNQIWFRHADIINGGTFELQMGNTSDERLGSDPASFPPSEMALKLI
jgi:putative alpha-1,2-mannosidase